MATAFTTLSFWATLGRLGGGHLIGASIMSLFGKFFAKSRQPDLSYAAEGFYRTALARANKADVDFHALADGYALTLANEGATVEQARSAHWGGVCGIYQDLAAYGNYVDAYEEAMEECGVALGDASTRARKIYKGGATTMLGLLLATEPDEYERFLKHMGV